ncbi:MAG: 1-acyl-sn-glycerol-3-phosphate acyltransferase [Bacteroidales bacterium]|nr:1-acyl-sn-glycerol-3-phosphate acyltransferase [Bacteroidales bacterium]
MNQLKKIRLPDVGKRSLGYPLIYWFTYLYFNIFYTRFTVAGRENIPEGKPVIFAGNHQNALMDALSILFARRGKVAFLARADMFNKRLIASILYSFRMLPVYRIRDGISSMGQNDEVFHAAAKLLKNGTPLALFPEGNHAGFKRLRPLKKGICRIAFMAEESANFELDLQIVPTGIDYSDYSKPGSKLLVRYGKPIAVKEFIPLYKENPQKAISALKERLSESMEPLIINIATEDNYDKYISICNLYRDRVMKKRKPRHLAREQADRKIIASLDQKAADNPEIFEKYWEQYQKYISKLDSFGIRDWLIRNKKTGIGRFMADVVFSLIVMPIFLYGLLINYLPYKLPTRFTRNVKDTVFHTSIHFGIGLVLFPVYFLLLQLVFSIFVKTLIARLIFAVSMPVSGIITFYFYKHLLKLRGRFRLLLLKYRNRREYDSLINSRKEIIHTIETIIQVA